MAGRISGYHLNSLLAPRLNFPKVSILLQTCLLSTKHFFFLLDHKTTRSTWPTPHLEIGRTPIPLPLMRSNAQDAVDPIPCLLTCITCDGKTGCEHGSGLSIEGKGKGENWLCSPAFLKKSGLKHPEPLSRHPTSRANCASTPFGI